MQSMFDTGETENQLIFVIMCVHTFEEVQHGYTKAEKAGCY